MTITLTKDGDVGLISIDDGIPGFAKGLDKPFQEWVG